MEAWEVLEQVTLIIKILIMDLEVVHKVIITVLMVSLHHMDILHHHSHMDTHQCSRMDSIDHLTTTKMTPQLLTDF